MGGVNGFSGLGANGKRGTAGMGPGEGDPVPEAGVRNFTPEI